jgi:S-ribosylhomocysteine lyase
MEETVGVRSLQAAMYPKEAASDSFCRYGKKHSTSMRLSTIIQSNIKETMILSNEVLYIMEKITSFTIDHLRLLPGVYVSRKDKVGDSVVTTFDLRMTRPNYEPVMNTAEVHTIEHLGATFLRNDPEWKDRVLYFGPMGCRTGFYLLLAGDLESKDIVELMRAMFTFIRDFEGEVPGACAKDCGNYLDMNLNMARYLADKYLKEVLDSIDETRLIYPE